MSGSTLEFNREPTNPGHFFACCGLFELAERLWPGSQARFTAAGFLLEAPLPTASARELLDALKATSVDNTMSERERSRLAELEKLPRKVLKEDELLEREKKALDARMREAPVRLGSPFDLTIDWFLDELTGGTQFKTWAGQQKVVDIAVAMHDALRGPALLERAPAEWLSFRTMVDALPFYFDAALGGSGSALDLGFATDPLKVRVLVRPMVELLAFIGLQRFRPARVERENRYRVCAWGPRLPPEIAAPAAAGAVPVEGCVLEFSLLYRTQYLKSFLPGQLTPNPKEGR